MFSFVCAACRNLTSPGNGSVTYTPKPAMEMIVIGSLANYTCNPGLELNGTAIRKCTINGWDGEEPECSGKLSIQTYHTHSHCTSHAVMRYIGSQC